MVSNLSTIYERSMEASFLRGLSKGYQEGHQEGHQEGRQKGRQEEKIEIAKNLASFGIDLDTIAKVTKLSMEDIKKLFDQDS